MDRETLTEVGEMPVKMILLMDPNVSSDGYLIFRPEVLQIPEDCEVPFHCPASEKKIRPLILTFTNCGEELER